VAHKRYVPWFGDAWQWWWAARRYGFREGGAPRVGAITVMGIGPWTPDGHVAYVEKVYRDGTFLVSEMNWGRWGIMDYRHVVSRAGILGFIY
jgi:surface antigen